MGCHPGESVVAQRGSSSHRIQAGDIYIDEMPLQNTSDNGVQPTNCVEHILEEDIMHAGLLFVGFTNQRQKISTKTNGRRFREHYGIGAKACASLMNDLKSSWKDLKTLMFKHHNYVAPMKPRIKDLLMALHWLKAYPTEGQMAGHWQLDEKTIRMRVRIYVGSIALLKEKKIIFGGFKDDEVFWVSVDGVHCSIYEPRKDPSSKWYSHKSNGASLTYELAVAIHSNRLVWIRGPFPASQHDITTFRGGQKNEPKDVSALQFQIPEGKKVIGDSGYASEPDKASITRSADSSEVKKFKSRVKARHETFNSRVKAFQILSTSFRHNLCTETLKEHKVVFEAVCVACQYDLENGHGLFQV